MNNEITGHDSIANPVELDLLSNSTHQPGLAAPASQGDKRAETKRKKCKSAMAPRTRDTTARARQPQLQAACPSIKYYIHANVFARECARREKIKRDLQEYITPTEPWIKVLFEHGTVPNSNQNDTRSVTVCDIHDLDIWLSSTEPRNENSHHQSAPYTSGADPSTQQTKLIVVGDESNCYREQLLKAWSANAVDFVLMSENFPREIQSSLHQVYETRQSPIRQKIDEFIPYHQLVEAYTYKHSAAEAREKNFANMGLEEFDILALEFLSSGKNIEETVETLLARIDDSARLPQDANALRNRLSRYVYKKIEAKNMAHAVAIAIKNDWIRV